MRECDDVTMQEALPAFRAGRLDAAEAETVRTHLATCDACALELELLTRAGAVLDRATPVVDLARITAAIPMALGTDVAAAPSVAPPRVTALHTRRWWRSRQFLAAAASIVVVVSLSLPARRGTGDSAGHEGRPDGVGSVAGSSTTGEGDAPSIDLAGGLADLSSAQLETLLGQLEQVEATIRAEPATVALPLLDTSEAR